MYEQIRNLREDHNITQQQIAQTLGVAQNTYSQYENGVIALTDEILIKLADYYSTSVDFLLERTGKK